MPVVIAMLRGVNVGGHHKIKMEALRALCTKLKLRDACTYVQSGNVIFKTDIAPNKLLVTFLANDPGQEARNKAAKIKTEPEELRMDRREVYIYFPNGMARPKMSWPTIERMLQTSGTGRNWNSVTKMLEIAEKLEAAN
jgi:uncharacterized protein (DUF1697 family)